MPAYRHCGVAHEATVVSAIAILQSIVEYERATAISKFYDVVAIAIMASGYEIVLDEIYFGALFDRRPGGCAMYGVVSGCQVIEAAYL